MDKISLPIYTRDRQVQKSIDNFQGGYMPLAVDATYKGETITVDEAVAIRDKARARKETQPVFSCVECGGAVRAMREGRNRRTGKVMAAHFEHENRHPDCPRSDVYQK
jgi:hypothetical protein